MAGKGRPAGKTRPKKGIGGRLPVKRSINLVLVDENKVKPLKAILSALLVIALAAAFGKFLVADRLTAMSQASSRISQLQKTLEETLADVDGYGEVEAKYAHYTYDDMNETEMGRVDRAQVVDLVSSIIKEQDNLFDMKAYAPRLETLVQALAESGSPLQGLSDFRSDVSALGSEIVAYREQVLSWSVKDNILEVELTGKSLENLNRLARKVEESPLVDSCTLTTANKDAHTMSLTALASGVRGKFIIYLLMPAEEEVEES